MIVDDCGIGVVLSVDEWRQVCDALDCLAANTPDFLEAMELLATLEKIEEYVGEHYAS